MEIQISDDDLKGFNPQATDKLREATDEFISDMITESNRIESGRSTTTGSPEVTSSMVNDARVVIRRGLVGPRKSLPMKVFRVVSAVPPLIVGFLYDSTKLQSPGYMLVFIVFIALAILAVTISIFKE